MNDYELLDFGDSRRLERFANRIFDRFCPAADGVRKNNPSLWSKADFRFLPDEKFGNSERGRWMPTMPEAFDVSFGRFLMELRGTPFGHLGVFPEQRSNWNRISSRIDQALKTRSEAVRVLNLFSYTGGSSLAAAVCGAPVDVVHVDSSRSVVDWARRNARRNGIGISEKKGRIRFIVEDVRKFVRRELKRGNRYDAVILDPPSYGHGVKGETWKLADDLPALLADLIALLSDHPILILLTAHTPRFEARHLKRLLLEAGLPAAFQTESISMDIPMISPATPAGAPTRSLSAGCGIFAFR